ncbi:MAG TPA: ABC transporter permease [Reyranella sp.]|jgi:peptide/nickel transport system permease protein|nr:ABC transporter permease [Reyranella sp.]
MLGYTIRRLLMAIPVMGIVALIVFSLLYLTPGDPAMVLAGDQASPEQIEKIRASLGLDQAPHVRFVAWLWQMANGDLGTSIFSGEPVTHMIEQRLEPTFSLLALSVVLSISVGVPFGVAAAARRGGWTDRALTYFTTLGFSLPAFIAGYALAFIFATTLRWLPVQGFVPLSEGVQPWLRNLILPAVTLSLVYAAIIGRVTRASMLEVLSEDYIRTARAKGVAPWRILFRHALQNAAVPVITVIGIGIATLIGSAVITENVFAIPGVGRLTVDAILHRDYPIIQGVVLLLSAGYVLVNIAVDLCYTLLDPRIRY